MNKYVHAIVLLVILLASSCNKGQKTLYVVFSYAPLTHVPNVKSEIVTISILMNFYDPLVRFDADFRPAPGLAEYWEKPDSITWVFHLRKGVQFQSGKKFTSEDVIYTYLKIISDSLSDYRANISSIDTIFAPDSYTVVFKLKAPCSTYLERISQILIVQNHCPDSLLSTYSCGTGALKYIKKDKSGAIYAVPNNRYFGDRVAFEKVVFTSGKDPILHNIKNKKNLFFLYTFSPPEKFLNSYGFIKIPGPLNTIRYIGINTRSPPFNNKSFRKALYFALCREKLVNSIKKIYNYPVLPAYEPALPSQIGYTFYTASDCLRKEEISKYLQSAGYNGEPIYLLVSNTRVPYARIIQKDYLLSGINLKVVVLKPREIFHRVKETGDFSLYLLGLVPQSIDIYSTVEGHFHTKDLSRSLGVKNYSGYSNPVLDSLIETAGHIAEKKEREKALQKIESILIDDLPVIPVVYEGNIFYLSPTLHWKPRIDRVILVNEIDIGQE